MGMTRRLATGMLASAILFGLQQSAVAGGGDFIGGAIVGGILGTIINQGLAHGQPAPHRRVAPAPRRVVVDPAEQQYWRNVQQALNAVGINVGTADGIPGGRTRQGVRRFQAQIGSEPSGQLTQSDYQTLMKRAGLGDSAASASVAPSAPLPDGDGQATQSEYGALSGEGTADDGVVTLAPVAKLPPASAESPDIRMPVEAANSTPSVVDDDAMSPVMSLAPKASLANVGSSPAAASVEPPAPAEKADTPPAVEIDVPPTTVAEASPAGSNVDTSVLDGLMASPAKPLQDADLNALTKKIAVLGLHLGDKSSAASESLKAAFESCTSKGNLMECSATNANYGDKIKMASLGEGEASTVFYIYRTVILTTPLPKTAIIAKLSETLKDVVDRPFMLIATPSACQVGLFTYGTGVSDAIEADAISGVATDTFVSLQDKCQAFFKVEVPVKDDLATGFAITLFDGRRLPKPAGDMAGASPKSSPPVAVPSELKL